MNEVQSFLNAIGVPIVWMLSMLQTVTTALLGNTIFKVAIGFSIVGFLINFVFRIINRLDANKKGD